MNKLIRSDLMSLEQYAGQRTAFRKKLLAHKGRRRLALGEHASLHFEDRLTIQYQVQEMLRIERIFEAAEIQMELDTYNPLIPNGRNLKATLMLEYVDPVLRRQALTDLRGVEQRVWLQVAKHPVVWAIADEDMPRSDVEKTAAVHFLRFELSRASVLSLKQGEQLAMGIDHPAYTITVDPVETQKAAALADDLVA